MSKRFCAKQVLFPVNKFRASPYAEIQ